MKTRYLPLLLMMVVLSVGYSISMCPATPWTAIIGVPGARTVATGVAASPDQQIFVTGTTDGSLTGQTISSPSDVFVYRYNPWGALQWSIQLGVIGADLPSIVADVNANTYLTGTTNGNFDGLPKTGSKDAFIVKLDPNGVKQWTGLLGVAGAETRGYGVAVDESGVSYVTGTTAGGLDGQAITGLTDAFITKYDSSGLKQWTRLFGVTGLKTDGRGIGVDSSGNAYVTGNSHDQNTNASSFLITKYNSAGEKQWMTQVGDRAWGNAIAVDAGGNCYATGTTQTSFDGQDLGSGSSGASFITKCNSSGERQWTRLLGSINQGGGITGWYFASGNTITIDVSGNVYVTGWMLKNVGGIISVAFIQKFDSTGVKQWTRRLGAVPVGGTSTYALGMGVATDRYPNVFVAGYLEGRGIFDGQPAIGVTDAFLTSKFNCASTQYFDAVTNTCVDIPPCANGMVFDQDAVACECPPGTHLVGGACVTQCPTNQYWDSASNSCKAIPTCNYGMIFNQTTGLCECPVGTHNINGTCVPACAANQYWDGSVCQPIPVCAAGTIYDPSTHLCVQEVVTAGSFASSVEFLYTGSNPIQTNVTPGAIDPKRVVVLKGKVLDKSNQPLVGVAVTILNHPEYGSTKTRSDGMFDLAVSGGGTYVVRYLLDRHLEAQRTITTPWQEFVWLPDVVLVLLDNIVTTVDLTQPVMQVAQGSAQTDADGTRKAVMLFPAGTTAKMVMPDGSQQSISTLHVRATEYTVGPNGPEAMPAPLPPSVAYTYAVELSVDEALAAGAKSVTFSQSIPIYIDNFIHFPVGQRVPIGYYDREAGRWVAIPDGRVVKIISITSGTPALAELDTDGDGTADNNPALGITDAERARVAELYQAGKELWRVQVQHFSSMDCNWGYGGCPGCSPPNQPDPDGDGPPNPPCGSGGSIIECESQVLGQRIPITGTPYTLNYRSNRVPGYGANRMLTIHLSGDTVPSNLVGIYLEIDVAGQHIEMNFGPTPNQKYDFIWDGLDAFGRRVYGLQMAKIRIGYAYNAVYGTPLPVGEDISGITGASFGMASGSGGGGGASARISIPPQMVLWQEFRKQIGILDQKAGGLGSWTINVNHALERSNLTVYLGDGTQQTSSDLGVITVLAGKIRSDGSCDSLSGLGKIATDTNLSGTSDVHVLPDGSFLVADASRILKVTNGRISRIAGSLTCVTGYSGDNGPAINAQLNGPSGVTTGPDGSIYIADYGNHLIRRIKPDGIIEIYAGGGNPVDGVGDGGLAINAKLEWPIDVVVSPDGSLYIAEQYNSPIGLQGRIRKIQQIGSNNIITTIAGGGTNAVADGIPATGIYIDQWLASIALGPDGSLYVSQLCRVFRINPDGLVYTVAGQGYGLCGHSGDGGPAKNATLNNLGGNNGLAVGRDGSIYIAEYFYIRKVWPNGIITTIAGNGNSNYRTADSDGKLAQQNCVNRTAGMDITPDGSNLLLADQASGVVAQIDTTVANTSDVEFLIPSEDGSMFYSFDSTGHHLQTLDSVIETILPDNSTERLNLFQFGYDNNGHLISIQDRDGSTTTITRDGSGKATSIVAPNGQTTGLMIDSNDYLTQITNPDLTAYNFTYYTGDAEGLMQTFEDPNQNIHTFEYDAVSGTLNKDSDPASGFKTLSRANTLSGYEVSMSTAMGRTTKYKVENYLDIGEVRTVSFPDGTQNQSTAGKDAVTTTIFSDGTSVAVTEGPDPRLGMQSPLPINTTIKMPSGKARTYTMNRGVIFNTTTNPPALATLTDTFGVIVDTTDTPRLTTAFDASNRTWTATTAGGRRVIAQVDDKNKLVLSQLSGLTSINYAYFPSSGSDYQRGKISTITTGDRQYSFAYYSAGQQKGLLQTVQDPLGRTKSFNYDTMGRMTSQTLPDGRAIGIGYDANGNVTSVTPPSRPAHGFKYNAVDQAKEYDPPTPPTTGVTQYLYNNDHQLTNVIRPDLQALTLNYNATTGKLNSITAPNGNTGYSYDPTTGNLASITAPDVNGGMLSYTYDGLLPLSETWSGGSVVGNVSWTYDNDFNIATETVAGSTINLTYDIDGLLLTGAGALAIGRNQSNGLITSTILDNVSTSVGYNDFGEPTMLNAAFPNNTVGISFVRDKLGRITQKTETINGPATTYNYEYDIAGRLTDVCENGFRKTHYEYDANSNRTLKRQCAANIQCQPATPCSTGADVTGTYDNQDRMTSYGITTYGYTLNGELMSKTVNSQITNYQYDVFGNLRSVTLPGGNAIDYVIDGRNRRIGKKVNSVLTQGFLYDGQLRVVAELDGSGILKSRFVYDTKVNVPGYMIQGGVIYRIITDHQGSPRFVVNSSTGAIAQRIDYDEFGNVTSDTNPGFQPFGFAGGLYDRDTGLVKFGARDYDPVTGRWTAKDPIMFSGGDSNLYGYVIDDPINLIDVSGLLEVSVPIGNFDFGPFGSFSGQVGWNDSFPNSLPQTPLPPRNSRCDEQNFYRQGMQRQTNFFIQFLNSLGIPWLSNLFNNPSTSSNQNNLPQGGNFYNPGSPAR